MKERVGQRGSAQRAVEHSSILLHRLLAAQRTLLLAAQHLAAPAHTCLVHINAADGLVVHIDEADVLQAEDWQA